MAWKIDDEHTGMIPTDAKNFMVKVLGETYDKEKIAAVWNVLIGEAELDDHDLKVRSSDVAEHISQFL